LTERLHPCTFLFQLFSKPSDRFSHTIYGSGPSLSAHCGADSFPEKLRAFSIPRFLFLQESWRFAVSNRRLILLTLLACAVLFTANSHGIRLVLADEWLPISPEELQMTSEPKAPGAPAIILYRQVDRDDSNAMTPHEYNYVREKIFTEEGRKRADVEIPFFKENESIVNIRARTVRPDGSVLNFDGKVYDQEIIKARGLKLLAKTFTLPDVQPGSIIEYHYTVDFREGYVFNSRWVLSDELFTKRGKFTLKPYSEFALQWSWPNGLPEGTKAPVNENKIIRMESNDIPAFLAEDDMPPEAAMKYLVDFIYSEDGFEKEPDKFWKKRGKKMNDQVEAFAGKRKAMEQAVSQIVAASDTPEVKLQKIYARVQQMRNTSYEREKTEQELKREKEKQLSNVEEVWKRGYGDGEQITLLFLSLARAAGWEAYPVKVATRNDHFFNPKLMKAADLNTYVVLMKLNGKDTYFDPGSAFTPFGLLPWTETAVTGLKLDKEGGSWVTTPLPESSQSQTVRKADLKMNDDGSLEGKLTVTYSGLEALWRRVNERLEDDTSRKRFLEDDVKATIPVGIDLELTNKPDWASSSPNLVAEFALKVPGWVSGAGRRALLPVGLFSGPEKHVCELTTRVHPLYYRFFSEKLDDVSIQLPLGWRISSVPKPLLQDAKAILYSLKVEDDKGTLHLERRLRSDILSLEQKYYPTLRNFYQNVRSGDEQQVVLQPAGAVAVK
jgi:uncharacterized protein DUF3857